MSDAGFGRPSLAVVVGASGGLGRALAELMVESGAYERVVALSRQRPDGWEDGARRAWAAVDILKEESIVAGARFVATLGVPTRIVVATGRLSGLGLAPEKSMRALDARVLGDLFAINAIAPALVAKHLLPLTPRDRTSLFAAISARVGSIGDNRLGGWYGYRASKAALNMFIRTLAIELRRARPLGVCVALHPGTVNTALSAPFQAGVPAEKLFSPRQAAEALLRVMDALGPGDTGGFRAWDGSNIPW